MCETLKKIGISGSPNSFLIHRRAEEEEDGRRGSWQNKKTERTSISIIRDLVGLVLIKGVSPW